MKPPTERPQVESVPKRGLASKELDRQFANMLGRELRTMFQQGFRLAQVDKRLFDLEIRIWEIRRRLERGLALRPEFDRQQIGKIQKVVRQVRPPAMQANQ